MANLCACKGILIYSSHLLTKFRNPPYSTKYIETMFHYTIFNPHTLREDTEHILIIIVPYIYTAIILMVINAQCLVKLSNHSNSVQHFVGPTAALDDMGSKF